MQEVLVGLVVVIVLVVLVVLVLASQGGAASQPPTLEWTPQANAVRNWHPAIDETIPPPPEDAYAISAYVGAVLLESTTQAAQGPLGRFLAQQGVSRGGLQLELLYLLSAISLRSLGMATSDRQTTREVVLDAMGGLLDTLRTEVPALASDFELGFPTGFRRYSAAIEGTADLTQGAVAFAKWLSSLDDLGQTAAYFAAVNLTIDVNILIGQQIEAVSGGANLAAAKQGAMRERLEAAFASVLGEADHEWEPGDVCPVCEEGVLVQITLDERPDAYALQCPSCEKGLVYKSDIEAIERERRPLAGLAAAENEIAGRAVGGGGGEVRRGSSSLPSR